MAGSHKDPALRWRRAFSSKGAHAFTLGIHVRCARQWAHRRAIERLKHLATRPRQFLERPLIQQQTDGDIGLVQTEEALTPKSRQHPSTYQ
jgi:hypothetical protein